MCVSSSPGRCARGTGPSPIPFPEKGRKFRAGLIFDRDPLLLCSLAPSLQLEASVLCSTGHGQKCRDLCIFRKYHSSRHIAIGGPQSPSAWLGHTSLLPLLTPLSGAALESSLMSVLGCPSVAASVSCIPVTVIVTFGKSHESTVPGLVQEVDEDSVSHVLFD